MSITVRPFFDTSQYTSGSYDIGGIAQVGYNLPTDLNAHSSAIGTIDRYLPAVRATVTQSDFFLYLSSDLDNLARYYFPAIPPLEGHLDGSLSVPLFGTATAAMDYVVLDVDLAAGIKLAQTFTFIPTDVLVSLRSSTGETRNGSLGQQFEFTAPSTGSGDITFTAEYTLTGLLRNQSGFIVAGEITASALGFSLETNLMDDSISWGPFEAPALGAGTRPFYVYDEVHAVSFATRSSTFSVSFDPSATTEDIDPLPTVSHSGDDYYYLRVSNESGNFVYLQDNGNDTLVLDASGTTGAVGYEMATDSGSTSFTSLFSGSGFQQVRDSLTTSQNAERAINASSVLARFDSSIEHIEVRGSNTHDLLIYLGGDAYHGDNGYDTFYADWSSALSGITWVNDPAQTQTVNGVSVSGLERLLLVTGSGDDVLSNTNVSADDVFITGAGNDTINSTGVASSIDAGSGRDTITVVLGTDGKVTVSGGTGSDTLTVDASNNPYGEIGWNGIDASGTTLVGVDSNSSMVAIGALLGAAVKLGVRPGIAAYGDTLGVLFDGIETLSITASALASYADLLVVRGSGGSYDGKGGTDTLYADWSGATTGITWSNSASSTAQTVNGVSIANVERLLVTTGSGADVISNSVASNDEIVTGAGNDTLDGGAGADILVGGLGNDTYVVDSDGDVLRELAAGGIDLVQSTISYMLPAELDNLALLGTAASGTGNAIANLITGNTEANTLSGEVGDDTLIGSLGGGHAEWWFGEGQPGWGARDRQHVGRGG